MKHILILLAIVFLSSCKLYEDVEVLAVQDVHFTNFDSEGVEAEVILQLDNPNWYKVVLTQSHVQLFLDGKSLGEVQLAEKMIIPKKTSSIQTMKVEADYSQVEGFLGNILAFIFKSEFTLEGKGYVKGRAFFVARKVPVEFQEKIDKSEMGF